MISDRPLVIVSLAVVTLISYLCGIYHWSALWVILVSSIVIAVHYFHTKSTEQIDNASLYKFQTSLQENEQFARQVYGDLLPKWVSFPDYEKGNFLNKAIATLWPHICNALDELLVANVNPVLEAYRPPMISSFGLTECHLGPIPFVITGIKTQESTPDQMVLDIKFNFSGDPRIKFVIGGFAAKIENVQLSGTLRVVLDPLVDQFPCFSAMSLSFVKNPKFSFRLVAMYLPIPGAAEMVDNILKNQVFSMYIWPRKIVIPLLPLPHEEVSRLNEVYPEGMLHVILVEAKNLPKMDRFGLTDAYCVMQVGAERKKSRVIQKSLNPVWKQEFDFEVYSMQTDRLLISMFDEDFGASDDFIGSIELSTSELQETNDLWLSVGNAQSGELHVIVTKTVFAQKSQQKLQEPNMLTRRGSGISLTDSTNSLTGPRYIDEEDEKKVASRQDTVPQLLTQQSTVDIQKKDLLQRSQTAISSIVASNSNNSANNPSLGIAHRSLLVFISVVRVDGLPISKSSGRSRNPYVILRLGAQEHKTTTKSNELNAAWNEEFKINAYNADYEQVVFTIMDSKKLRKDVEIGTATLPLKKFNVDAPAVLECLPIEYGKKQYPTPSFLQVKIRINGFGRLNSV